jgi:tetratricopeptide (TPR) repeat protein
MKSRINIKFIAIFVILAGLAVAAVGGMWYLRQADASRIVRIADELAAEGEYLTASRHYARAVRREPANREYLQKYQHALQQIRPETGEAAREQYTNYLTSLRHDAQHHTHLAEAHLKLIREIELNAVLIGTLGARAAERAYWTQNAEHAGDMLRSLPEHDPQRSLGYFYRGLAHIENHTIATDDVLRQALADLKRFIELNPNHDRGWATLLSAHRTLIDHYRAAGQRQRGDDLAAEYRQLAQTALADAAEGPFLRLFQLRELIRIMGDDERALRSDNPRLVALGLRDADHARARLNELADQLYADATGEETSDPQHVEASKSAEPDDSDISSLGRFDVSHNDPVFIRDAANALLAVRALARIEQGFNVLRRYVDRNPDHHVYRFMLGMLHFRMEQLDEADQRLTEVLDAQPLRTGLLSQMQHDLRRHAASSLVDVAHRRWQRAAAGERGVAADEGEVRSSVVELAEAVRRRHERLKHFVTDPENDPLMIRADARVAMVEGQHHTAADRLERLIRMGAADYEIYASASFALDRIGQSGLALERMNQAVATMPFPLPSMLWNKALFEERLGRIDDARQTLRTLRELAPDDEHVTRTVQQALVRLEGDTTPTTPGAPDAPPAGDELTQLLFTAQEHYEQGDLDSARAMIQQGLQAAPDDVRFLGAAAQIDLSAGNREQAQQWLARALQLDPANRQLRRLEATLTTDDPIEALIRYNETIHADDEIERVVITLLSLGAMSQQQRQLQRERENDGDALAAAEAADLADRAKREADRMLSRAVELAPNDGRVIEYRFTNALRAQDFALAERMIDAAAAVNADQAGGRMYRGAYQLERQQYDRAVRTFLEATERMPYSGQAWRGLGVAYARLGNMREAIRAFDQSYRINPRDLNTVREFLGVLERTGDAGRALRIAQEARRLFVDNADLHEYWLDLESRAGDQAMALTERRRRFRETPGDRQNAVRLALLLSTYEPTDALLLNDDGTRRFTVRRWAQMSSSEQRRHIAEESQRWQTEVDRVLGAIRTHHGRDMEAVALEAMVYRLRNQVDRGEQVFREYLDSIPSSERTVAQRLALVQFFIEAGRHQQALEELQAARPFQSEDTLEVDFAMANVLLMLNDYGRALELYERVQRVNPTREGTLRLLECLVNVGRIDEAESRMETFLREEEAGGRVRLIQALIARGRAQQHLERGETSQAERILEEHRRLIDMAIQAMPTDASPHVILAQTNLAMYRHGRQRRYLDQCMIALDRAAELAPTDQRVGLLRIDALREEDNRRAAIHEVNRLIEQHPTSEQIHRVRLLLHIEQRDLDGAVRAARHSAETFSHSAIWQEQYARLLAEAGDHAGAADAMRTAFEAAPSPELLAAYLMRELQLDRQTPAAMLQYLNRHRELIEQDLALQGIRTALMHQSGQHAQARSMVEQSYLRLRAEIREERRGNVDVQNWFNAHAQYLRSFSPRQIDELFASLNEAARTAGGAAAGDPYPHFFETSWIARYWAMSGPEGLSRAIELMRDAIDETPENLPQIRANLLFDLSGFQISISDYPSAVETLRRSIALNSDNAIAQNNLAFLLADRMDRPEEAIHHAQRAVELRPNDPHIIDTLGWVQYKLAMKGRAAQQSANVVNGHFREAERHLRQSLELSDTATTRVHLARLLIATDRAADAVNSLQRALELDPNASRREEIEQLLADISRRQ